MTNINSINFNNASCCIYEIEVPVLVSLQDLVAAFSILYLLKEKNEINFK